MHQLCVTYKVTIDQVRKDLCKYTKKYNVQIMYYYLILVSCSVNSLISRPESLREDKVPGTSLETTFDNLFIEADNLARAYRL